ncbi:MAG TPA: fibronectin type III domain-containing protein [Flavipsychrobacter sp.]|nr:fibronectin type III domain-containing protein [Flavipsychrobacter sp.]
MRKVALSLHKMSAAALVIFARGVRTSMAENSTTFPTPPVAMPAFLADVEALELAEQGLLTGGIAARVIRDQQRVIVENELRELSWYVDGIAKGNEATIHLAGMVAAVRGPRRYDTLAAPIDMMAESPYTGTIKLRWKGAHNAKSYAVEYCPDPITGTQWHNGTYNSGANAVLEGFETGKKYWFRVRALGSQSMKSDWSDPICHLVS